MSPESMPSSAEAKPIALAPPCPLRNPPCFLCWNSYQRSSNPQAHPVDTYRAWDDMYTAYCDETSVPLSWREASYRHWNMPWILSAPFLQRFGYEIVHFSYEPGHEVSALVSPALDKDGKEVFIKSMPVSGVSPEYQINCVLNSDALRADPRNHTVPILGTHVFQPNFSVAERDFRVEDRRAFVVMPKLKLMQTGSRPYPLLCIPPDIGACLEFARQVSEGLAFMHEHGISHGDIHCSNILIQSDNERKPRYFFIDFQASSYFPRPWRDPPRRLPRFISHLVHPERGTENSFDPFSCDIWFLGETFRWVFYRHLDRPFDVHLPDFRKFVSRMQVDNPLERPTAQEVHDYVVAAIADCPRSILQTPMEGDEELEKLHAAGAEADVMRPSDIARS